MDESLGLGTRSCWWVTGPLEVATRIAKASETMWLQWTGSQGSGSEWFFDRWGRFLVVCFFWGDGVCMYIYIFIVYFYIYIYRYIPRTRMTFFLEGWSGTRYIYKYGVKLYSSSWWYERYWYFIHLSLFKWLNSGKNAAYIGNVLTKEGPIYQLEWWIMLSHRHTHSLLYTSLDLPKGAEWMIRGDHTPSLGSKQNPLEDAGIYTYLFLD